MERLRNMTDDSPANSSTMKLFSSPWEKYQELNAYLLDHGDPRTKNRWLVGKMDNMLMVTMVYLLVIYFGPMLMRNRRPFKLRTVMVLHNFTVSAVSMWIVIEMLINARRSKYQYLCNPYQVSYAKSDLRIVQAAYVYYILKAFELLDTLFMILKKNNDKVTFLHVSHHLFMFPATYFACILAPCCQGVSVVVINSCTHVIMYGYYGLTLFPSMRKHLWWKKYLGQLQLVQFISLVILQGISFCQSCDYPKALYYSYLPFAVTQSFLFADYYARSYLTKRQYTKSGIATDPKKLE